MTQDTEALKARELPLCPFCGHQTDWNLGDIDGWIASVSCSGCDMVGPMSEFKYEDPEEAKVDALARWHRGFPSPTPDAGEVQAVSGREKIAERAERWLRTRLGHEGLGYSLADAILDPARGGDGTRYRDTDIATPSATFKDGIEAAAKVCDEAVARAEKEIARCRAEFTPGDFAGCEMDLAASLAAAIRKLGS